MNDLGKTLFYRYVCKCRVNGRLSRTFGSRSLARRVYCNIVLIDS